MSATKRRNPQNPDIHTRVYPEMKAQLEAMAAANKRSLSAELNHAVRMHVVAQDYREIDRG